MAIQEKRRFSRIPFDAQVIVTGKESKWKCQLLDISLKGALIQRPENWSEPIGGDYDLSIQLGEAQSLIRMQTTASHEDAERIGFRCSHIDLDSMSHLRRLVELNLGESELLSRELSTLINNPSIDS